MLIDRARLLRRLGRFVESAATWESLAVGSGPVAAHAWVEVTKLREHRLADLAGALAAELEARSVVDRRRRLALVDPALERGLVRRLERLSRRVGGVVAMPAERFTSPATRVPPAAFRAGGSTVTRVTRSGGLRRAGSP